MRATTPRLEELRRKFEENPRRFFAPLASELRRSGAPEDAVALCRAHLPRHPDHLSGFIVYGQALYDLGELTEARAVFEQALALDPENSVALRMLGDIAKRRGDRAGARRWYERVLEADPRNDDIAAQLDGLAAPSAADPVPFRPPREGSGRAVANASAMAESSARPAPPPPESSEAVHARPEAEGWPASGGATPEDDPFAFPAVAVSETEPAFEEGLEVPVIWPDTADLVARKLTPRALPVFPMPADEDTLAAFGRERHDPPAPVPREAAAEALGDDDVAPWRAPVGAGAPATTLAPPVDAALAAPAEMPTDAPSGFSSEALSEATPDAPRLGPDGSRRVPEPQESGVPAAMDDADAAVDFVFAVATPARAAELPPSMGADPEPAGRAEEPPVHETRAVSPSAPQADASLPDWESDGGANVADEPPSLVGAVQPPGAGFRTETMAELMLAQGLVAQAVVLFEELARQRPDDPQLAARLAAARSRLEPPAPASHQAPDSGGLTARQRLAQLAQAMPMARREERAPVAGGLPVAGLDAVFGGMGRPADERVAREWADALAPGTEARTGAGQDPFNGLWSSLGDAPEVSLEQYFTLATPPASPVVASAPPPRHPWRA